MDVKEFIQRLDVLYEKADILENKLKLYKCLEEDKLPEYIEYLLKRKIKILINEYFEEEEE